MTTRQERRQHERALGKQKQQQQRGFTGQVRTTSGGGLEYHVNTADLDAPEREFYASTARVMDRGVAVAFAFGQFIPGTDVLYSAVAVEVPKVSMPQFLATFHDSFRASLDELAKGSFPPFPSDSRPQTSVSYPAHIVRIAINQGLAALDFYDVVPVIAGAPDVHAAIRIKVFPPIARFFVQECDKIGKSL